MNKIGTSKADPGVNEEELLNLIIHDNHSSSLLQILGLSKALLFNQEHITTIIYSNSTGIPNYVFVLFSLYWIYFSWIV